MCKTFSVIGGDLRQLTLAALLCKDGFNVNIFGFDSGIDTGNLSKSRSLSEAARADFIVLPLPVSQDNITLNAPFSKERISLETLMDYAGKNTIILGGKTACLPGVHDYFDREELNIKNAVPTAEGAIEIALSETAHTLFESKCLIIGFGRIGKILADRLKAFGCGVTVSARKYSDFAWINALGYNCMNSNNLDGNLSDFDIIFNTVPSVILDAKLLKQIPKNTLIIDLASKPGGVDFEPAKELGLKVIWALSLPGKCAPITSGKIIKDTIINILSEMEAI